jgi:type IV pilus assembly protein PilW
MHRPEWKPGSRVPRIQRGLSLVELMVAISIGLFLLLGLVTVFATSNRAYLELNRSSQQIENGRFAVQILSDDVAMAGYYGRYYTSLTAPAALPDPCEKSNISSGLNNLRDATPLVIQGYNAPASSPITTCLAAGDHVANTDVLVIRRADAQETAVGLLNAAQVYIQTNADPLSNPVVALGTGAAAFPLTDRDSTKSRIRKYHVHIYYVAPCSVPAGGGTSCTGANDDGGAPIPTLKRMELTLNAAGTALDWRVVPLVEGIENFQVDYGLDADTDGVPDGTYTTDPGAVANWLNVVAVRISVLARNLEASSGYTDAKTYDMGVGYPIGLTPGGPYKRHVYNAMVRLVNPSARREPSS